MLSKSFFHIVVRMSLPMFPPKFLNSCLQGDEGAGKSSLIARLQTRKRAVDEKSVVGTGLEYTLIDVKDDYEGEGYPISSTPHYSMRTSHHACARYLMRLKNRWRHNWSIRSVFLGWINGSAIDFTVHHKQR